MITIKNPIVSGYHADPEARFYEGKYWIYVTQSETVYEKQQNLDVYSSTDLQTWEKHEDIINMSDFPWVYRAVWAPTIIEKNGKYYLVFATNDIQNDDGVGGLEVAVSDSPEGPFNGHIGKPIIDKFINHAQPIDAHLFKDDDGVIYLYYGGWRHCNIAIMNETIDGFIPHHNGEIFIEVTPDEYVEGPCMLKKDGEYYFMWSQGDWVNGTYHVCCSKSSSPYGPFTDKKIILESKEGIANGPGHHGYLNVDGTDDWLMVYHRRIIGDLEAGHRILCIDRVYFEDGNIKLVDMTNEFTY